LASGMGRWAAITTIGAGDNGTTALRDSAHAVAHNPEWWEQQPSQPFPSSVHWIIPESTLSGPPSDAEYDNAVPCQARTRSKTPTISRRSILIVYPDHRVAPVGRLNP